ncbi:hypothetical protein BN982_03991 [Halobacillus karajensis]|uniref:PAS domain-containing protein n=2 Tax=Halobacillus karajensis TaxID=195088 RepID=A0A024P9I6_9BACI|nr:hypothetical protein BN982_03991 [Halobacillus karajensis]CDQ25523.1 hypothetical protein BN983_03870 [Halobacillus karajensis]CDQ28947.1 hypothetical protein BN981_03290 [Halobacillus karajensis]
MFARLEEIQQNEFIKAAIDHVGAGVVITDPEQDDNPLIYCNQGFEELTGYKAEEVLGRNCRLLQGEETDPKHVDHVREGLANRKPVKVEMKNYRKDGTVFWNDCLAIIYQRSNGYLHQLFLSSIISLFSLLSGRLMMKGSSRCLKRSAIMSKRRKKSI